jgi:DHA2 family multidrug resistance protein
MSASLAVAGAFPGAPSRAPVNKWLVTVSVTFGTLMGAIDSSIVNVAIPHLIGSLGATTEQITWVTTGFAIATVIVMPLTAFLASLFGQKRVYMFCLALFLVGSALCGTARSLTALVLWRVVQGIGAGALQPTEQAILRQTFPPKEQGMAMALFGMAVMLGPAIGPTLGGWIVDNYSWPWIFYINLPVGALGLFMVWRFVHEPEDIKAANRVRAEAQKKHMDWSGIALLSVGLATLQFVLEEGDRNDWFSSAWIGVLAFVAVFALAAFIVRELSAPVPAVNLRLFKDKTFLSGTLIGAVMFAMLMANMFLLPLFMQQLLGFTATQSGVALMPRVLVMIAATPLVGRLYNSVSPRLMVALGVIFFAVGAYQMSHLTLASGSAGIVSAIMIQGVGFACLFVPLTTAAISTIPRHLLSDATGLNSLLRQVGGSFGLAIFATLLRRSQVQAGASISASLASNRPDVLERLHLTAQALITRGLDAVAANRAAIEVLGLTIQRQAAVLAFEKMFLLSGIAFLVVLPLVIFLKVDRHAGEGPHPEVHLEL